MTAARLALRHVAFGEQPGCLDALDLSAYVRPGAGIVFGQGTAEPLSLTETLVQQRAAFPGSSVFF